MAAQARTSYGGAGTTPPTGPQATRTSYGGGAQAPAPSAAPPGAPPAAPSPGPFAPGGFASKATAAVKKGQGSPSAWRGAPPGAAYGSQSGPGILGQWFNERATGTDPGWEYAMGRASDQINNQYAARGGYNSSGAVQSLNDMYANASAQREGQLDTLAAGASTEHQNQLNGMFGAGLGIANGVSGATAPYGVASGSQQGDSLVNQQNLILGKSGVDQKKAAAEQQAASSWGGAAVGALGKLYGAGG